MKQSTFFRRIILLLSLLWLFAWAYYAAMGLLAKSSDNADFIYTVNWKAGCILITCYSIVKLLSPVLGFYRMRVRLLLSIVLYSFSFALIVFPLFWVFFFQPFLVNTFFHALIAVFIVEFFSYDMPVAENNKG
jgi:hypothetical protein